MALGSSSRKGFLLGFEVQFSCLRNIFWFLCEICNFQRLFVDFGCELDSKDKNRGMVSPSIHTHDDLQGKFINHLNRFIMKSKF